MTIRVGLKSTEVFLTEVGKEWFLKAYPQGIVYEYDENEPFDLKAMGADFVDVTCQLGIPYRLPTYIDGEITFRMADQETEVE